MVLVSGAPVSLYLATGPVSAYLYDQYLATCLAYLLPVKPVSSCLVVCTWPLWRPVSGFLILGWSVSSYPGCPASGYQYDLYPTTWKTYIWLPGWLPPSRSGPPQLASAASRWGRCPPSRSGLVWPGHGAHPRNPDYHTCVYEVTLFPWYPDISELQIKIPLVASTVVIKQCLQGWVRTTPASFLNSQSSNMADSHSHCTTPSYGRLTFSL